MFKVAFVAAIAMVCGLCDPFEDRECVQLITTPSGSSHQTWYDQINKSF